MVKRDPELRVRHEGPPPHGEVERVVTLVRVDSPNLVAHDALEIHQHVAPHVLEIEQIHVAAEIGIPDEVVVPGDHPQGLEMKVVAGQEPERRRCLTRRRIGAAGLCVNTQRPDDDAERENCNQCDDTGHRSVWKELRP